MNFGAASNLVLRRVAICIVSLVAVLSQDAWSADLTTAEVKARYIYNFVKYLTWPETRSTAADFAIGVINSDDVESALRDVVQGKTALGKPFTVKAGGSPNALGALRMLYIDEGNRERISDLLASLPKTTVTVGEGPGFLARGGMIEFNLKDGKVRFSVNLKALREAGFTVDSKLLVVAEEVRGK